MPVASASNTYFKDRVLNVPGYRFGKASPWRDVGSSTLLAEGTNLTDGSRVLAKIASAHSPGALCIEREFHVHGRIAAVPESSNTTLKLLESFTLPPQAGDCVVLIMTHPGDNALGRFFPSARMNDLLLAGHSPVASDDGMILDTPGPVSESRAASDSEGWDAMDIASFLEFAIEAARCLEVMHKAGLIHREIRLNAFHLSSFSGLVRLVHFGNRSQSLEQLGGPSALVLRSATDAMEENEKHRLKEALCYLAPEQTGSVETIYEDHRTDLYSLGIVFWMLLVGHMPFDGGPMELLHSIVQKRPLVVHEARRDVPLVVALIIDKLLAKKADQRYNSAFGLKADLLECQKRLNLSCSTPDLSIELIPLFQIGQQDKFMDFIIPFGLFGREAEIEQIGSVIRQASASHSRTLAMSRLVGASEGRASSVHDDASNSGTSRSPEQGRHETPLSPESSSAPALDYQSTSTGGSHERAQRRDRRDGPRVRAVVIHGAAGVGKSSLINWYQPNWRRHGLWGFAKFQDGDSTPFSAILACLSTVLRQLMSFQSDLQRFTSILQSRLGPQVHNLPLLFQGAPELRDLLDLFNVTVSGAEETLSTEELRVRFQSLVVNVFCVLSEVRMLALFLDDLHFADQSSIDLITTLAGSRSNILILASFRSETQSAMMRVNGIFASTPQTVWIPVHPLPQEAISSLVSLALHRNESDCSTLTAFLFRTSRGNAFSARNMLLTLQRAGYIKFNWENNWWDYDIATIESSFVAQEWVSNPGDVSFLIAHIHDLPDEARKYLLWASLFGTVFKVQEISFVMDKDPNEQDADVDGPWGPAPAVPTSVRSGKPSVRGLHHATAEGWLVQRARDMCSWTHDRYRQAALDSLALLPSSTVEKMSLRIVLMLMNEPEPDTYRIAEHCKRCLPLILSHPKRDQALQYLLHAASAASARGALEVALHSYTSAKALLGFHAWTEDHSKTFSINLKIAELLSWKGDVDASDELLVDMLTHVVDPQDRARVWRACSRNSFVRKDYTAAIKNIVLALSILGVTLNPAITMRETDEVFEVCKGRILAAGNDQILAAPKCTDPKVDLCVSLLNDAGTAAYWTGASALMTSIGLKIIELAFRSGICPGTALGFFWILGAAAEIRELFRFSVDIARLGLRIASMHGGAFEKSRAETYYCAMVSGYDNVHLRANIARCEMAFKQAQAAGDRMYAGFARVYQLCTQIFVSEDLNETLAAAEDIVKDAALWSEGSDVSTLAKGLAACLRGLAGQTDTSRGDTALDTPFWKETEYIELLHMYGDNAALNLSWYNSFKMACLYSLGFFEHAASLGYQVFAARYMHPNHRHSRYGLFWHSLALVQCCRFPKTTDKQREAYLAQVELNQSFIRKWLSPSPVNTSTWISLVDAEVAALNDSSDAYRLYDVAVRLAINNDWIMEEGWALYLQGSHFVRNGVEGLGRELQRRAISRQAQWSANGIITYMTSAMQNGHHVALKKPIFSAEAGVQTVIEEASTTSRRPTVVPVFQSFEPATDSVAELDADDLRSILKWSQIISSDVNLSACLQRLTEIAADGCKAQFACVVMRTDEGDYAVATTMVPPQPCTVFENMSSVRSIHDPLRRAVIQHTLNVQEPLFVPDVTQEPRFASEALRSSAQSILCVPMMSNRGQTFGVIYLSSRMAFTLHDSRLLGLLISQAGISISNALLFRSLQQATKANLKMISAQKSALEETRRSREDALKATKIKSNFLASMSHELRTPFSSFYGLLDILGETPLDAGQREIVATAKQSCELLLKIIDSILDYSKLEASALKLEISAFAVEDMIADCMELLLPLAAQKLEMAYNIEPDVPRWISADYARIRQVLMNLLGNALKFTEKGSVTVTLSLDKDTTSVRGTDVTFLKCVVEDTGIGLTEAQMDNLFQPFQQADNSSTRRFSGTGLGLSISMQLCKLMGGDIGVSSTAGVGSIFFFRIPVTVAENPASVRAGVELSSLREKLAHPVQLRVLLCSPWQPTLSLLRNMLSGLFVATTETLEEAEAWLHERSKTSIDFVLVDHPDESRVEALLAVLQSSETHAKAKIIHLYTATTSTGRSPHIRWSPGAPEPPRQSPPGSSKMLLGNIVRMSKPPRTMRLLLMLASLKDVLPDMSLMPVSEVRAPVEDPNGVQRTLYGNVLIAEDNNVARQLLVKQLTRYKLTVTATCNGKEAVEAWEAREPGYFSVALFDHHMPIMDGVEATKQIRLLEDRNKVTTQLPIVALSADCQESTKALCLSAGMNGFLAKPLKKNDLTSLLSMFWQLVQPPPPG